MISSSSEFIFVLCIDVRRGGEIVEGGGASRFVVLGGGGERERRLMCENKSNHSRVFPRGWEEGEYKFPQFSPSHPVKETMLVHYSLPPF